MRTIVRGLIVILPDDGRMDKDPQLILIGRNIRRIREEVGFGQEEFALMIDLDRSYYGRVERGGGNLRTLNLLKIAEALKVEVGDLFPKMSVLKRHKKKTESKSTKK